LLWILICTCSDLLPLQINILIPNVLYVVCLSIIHWRHCLSVSMLDFWLECVLCTIDTFAIRNFIIAQSMRNDNTFAFFEIRLLLCIVHIIFLDQLSSLQSIKIVSAVIFCEHRTIFLWILLECFTNACLWYFL